MASGLQMVFGGIALYATAGMRGEFGELDVSDISNRSWLGLLWLVVAGSVLAYSAYMYANSTLPIAIVSTYAYVNPVIAVLLGATLDNDTTGPNVLIGGTVILLAVIFIVSGHIVQRRRPGPGA
jgi:drug/metabolite transporter (DMT)-like permease